MAHGGQSAAGTHNHGSKRNMLGRSYTQTQGPTLPESACTSFMSPCDGDRWRSAHNISTNIYQYLGLGLRCKVESRSRVRRACLQRRNNAPATDLVLLGLSKSPLDPLPSCRKEHAASNSRVRRVRRTYLHSPLHCGFAVDG